MATRLYARAPPAIHVPADVSEKLARYFTKKDQSCEVWADNWKTFRLFRALRTQWRMGFSGPTGLDYGAAATVAHGLGIRFSERRLAELLVMELAALAELRKEN